MARRALVAALPALALTIALLAPSTARAQSPFPSDDDKPKLAAVLVGFRTVWRSSGDDDLTGRVRNAQQLQWNDRLTSWINQHATTAQKFRALQDAQYLTAKGSGYDQSITIADGLGQRLGTLYAKGRLGGKLPLTTKLLNTTTGSAGDYVDTGDTKAAFGYPRPYLPVSTGSVRASGDQAACAPSRVSGESLASLRKGQPWATAAGDLRITRVAPAVDTSRRFATTDAYSAGLTLATLLPELAPSILARVSEAANNRIVLGVHYPLDVIGGRMAGQAAVAARWSDEKFRTQVLQPARRELIGYLQSACGDTLAACIAADRPYTDDPYGGAAPPALTGQVVTDRTTALIAYTERLGYGFTPITPAGLGASVPQGAQNLLRTAFPTLTGTQRQSVLAQTETASGNALDTTTLQALGLADGSWQRLNLAAALSATVLRLADGTVRVLSVGGSPTVLDG